MTEYIQKMFSTKSFFVIIFYCMLNWCLTAYINNDYELVMVHGIFRHGARSTYAFYPNDPHINNTFYPIGLGGLTNEGKLQEYELGQYMRNEYKNFLDNIYKEDVIEVRSTGVERTIMSAQLLLAGLFPPIKYQVWHKDLNWQPIPIFFRKEHEEDILHPKNCDYRFRTEKNLTNDPNVQALYVKPYKSLYDYINRHSGLNIGTVQELIEFYFIVSTENEMNLTLPDWVKRVYPEPVHSSASLTYHYLNYDIGLRRLNVGYLLQKMINDTMAKIEGNISHQNKKMYLYSGHETTVGFFLDAMNILEPPHVPPYASIILLEMHKKHNNYFVMIKYKRGPSMKTAEILKIPGCTTMCPLEQFLKINDELFPSVSIKEACEM